MVFSLWMEYFIPWIYMERKIQKQTFCLRVWIQAWDSQMARRFVQDFRTYFPGLYHPRHRQRTCQKRILPFSKLKKAKKKENLDGNCEIVHKKESIL